MDQVLAPSEERVAYAAAIELDAIADTDRLFTLTVDRGVIRDTKVSLELTEDRRLASTSVDTTGQAGRQARC